MKEPSSSRILLKAPDPSEAMLEAELRSRASAFWWVGVLVLVTAPADRFRDNPHPWWSLGLRVLMSLVCWAVAWQIRRFSARPAQRLTTSGAFVVSSLFCLLAVVSGGVDGANFVWTIVLPIAGVALAGDSLWYAIPFSLLNAAVAGGLVHAAHLPTGVLLNQVMNRLSAGAIAVIAALFQRRLRGNLFQLAGELRDSRERVIQSQRLAFVGQLAAGVAHEINNPLSFVLSNVEFVRKQLGDRADREQLVALDEAILGSRRIRQIVTDLRALSRGDSGSGGSCDLAAAIEEAVRLAGQRVEALHIEKRLPTLPKIQMPHHRVVQVLVNLLVNAADAIAESGRSGGAVTLRAETADGTVVLDVDDNGPGFLPGQLERLFTPFYTTKSGKASATGVGLGLGLALCHAYVEQFGGTITAENAPNGGAHFRLRLPTAPPTA